MQRTKTDAALADAERSHADDPERAELLSRARRFKASWIELAEALTGVKRGNRWRDWGFESFEAYARQELHIRPETAEKLTGSYSFLKRRAPSVIHRDALHEPVPSYQAVDFLRRAEASETAPRDAVEEIRRRVIDEAAPAASVSRAFGSVVFPVAPEQSAARDLAGLKNVARRLRDLLSETRAVPRKLAGETREAVERLLEVIDRDDEAAA
jgi:lipopolysaccharide biosynthesis regulator YciM